MSDDGCILVSQRGKKIVYWAEHQAPTALNRAVGLALDLTESKKRCGSYESCFEYPEEFSPEHFEYVDENSCWGGDSEIVIDLDREVVIFGMGDFLYAMEYEESSLAAKCLLGIIPYCEIKPPTKYMEIFKDVEDLESLKDECGEFKPQFSFLFETDFVVPFSDLKAALGEV
jgi:hypothetical protein